MTLALRFAAGARHRQGRSASAAWKAAAAAITVGGLAGGMLVASGPASAASTGATTFRPASDTYADVLAPTKNFSRATTLRINQERKYTRVPYLSFDVVGIPAGATDVRAVLKVRSSETRSFTVRAHRTGAFDAARLTWNNRPAVGSVLSTGGTPVAGRDMSFDVSQAVTRNGTVNLALTAVGDVQSSTWFHSMEHATVSLRPRLSVTWTVPDAPAPTPTTAAPTPAPTTVTPSPTPTVLPPAPAPTVVAPSPTPPTVPPAPTPTVVAPSPTPPTVPPVPTPTVVAPSPTPTPAPSRDLLVGASVVPTGGRTTVAQELAFLEANGINVEMRRVFDPGFDRNFMNKGGMDVGVRTTHYSFKPDMAALAAGRMDTDIRAFLGTIPAGHPTYLTIWHEPEDNFTTSEQKATYRAGWQRFSQLVREARRPEVKTSWVMMAWSWTSQSGRNPEDWWPGDGVVDNIGIDSYNEGSLSGARWDSPGKNLGLPAVGDSAYGGGYVNGGPLAFIKRKNVTFGIAEFGSLENTNRIDAAWSATDDKAGWISDAVKFYADNGALYVEYFHAGPYRGPWWLDSSPAALGAYAKASRDY